MNPSFSVERSIFSVEPELLLRFNLRSFGFRLVLHLQPSSFKFQIHSLISTFRFVLRFVLLRFVNLQLQSSKSSWIIIPYGKDL
ncbi:hypothetical protein P8452_17443 [Trifolium repens]|nr:hypothetical protein QL285_057821 [Trifolium repens]WJX28764.1 hypothetical protein P8452_17443 [Trifolium repens]